MWRLDWREWQKIIETANLIIIDRKTYADILPDELADLLKKHQTENIEDLHAHLAGKVYRLEIEPILISSSHIRYQLQQSKQPNHQLPEKVYQYILDNKLYQEP